MFSVEDAGQKYLLAIIHDADCRQEQLLELKYLFFVGNEHCIKKIVCEFVDENIQVRTLLPSIVKEGNPQKVDAMLHELGRQCFTVSKSAINIFIPITFMVVTCLNF